MKSNQQIQKLRDEIQRKRNELQKLMETSGSFCSKTPGYTETEHEIKFMEDRLKELENQIRNHSKKQKIGEIGIDSEIEMIPVNNQGTLRIKIMLQILTPIPNNFRIATPDSRVGKQLLGKKVNDVVKIGDQDYKITKIK